MSAATQTVPPLDRDEFRSHADQVVASLVPELSPDQWEPTLEGDVRRARELQRRLWDSGLSRAGWTVQEGGFGGNPGLRTVLAEVLATNDLLTTTSSTVLAFSEILGPAFAKFASDELRAEVFTPFLSGREQWCQGFSEPGAGSDLAALQTSAVAVEDGWVLNGNKIWTSLAQFAERGIILARTGTRESRHRGISAFMVHMSDPGIDVRPLRTMGDRSEFSELFLTDVHVPARMIIGNEGDGWAFAMSVLPNERGSMMWQESAMLAHTLTEFMTSAADRLEPMALGNAVLDLCALRARSRQTQQVVARGDMPGVEASLDKILDTIAHQSIFDLVRDFTGPGFVADNGERMVGWRDEFYYSRAASIYGGTAEIQRSIVAQRLLGLPRA